MVIALVYRPMKGMVMDVTEAHLRQMRSAFPDDQVVYARSAQGLRDMGIRAECIFGGLPMLERLPGEISLAQYCEWAGTVKWFHTIFTGVEIFAKDEAFSRHGVRLSNSTGISALPISDQIMAFALSFARCLPQAYANKTRRIWARPAGTDELCGRTLGIIGMGNIGKATAKKARAFDMTVVGYKRSPAEIDGVDRLYYGDDGLYQMLAVSDYVVMLLPSTPETYHVMDEKHFAAMKDGAFFINSGRGACVDTQALIDALQSGKLGGAALDAVDPEPLPDDCPLWDMENVILTAHYGGDGKRTIERGIELFIENMSDYRAGRRLKTEVDLHAGGR